MRGNPQRKVHVFVDHAVVLHTKRNKPFLPHLRLIVVNTMESPVRSRYAHSGINVVHHDIKPPSEQDLIRRAQQGELEAFETLYRKTTGRTYAICLRMCSNPSLAEDLCQEAYIRAWQKLTTFKGASSFSTWLHRLTVNVVLSHFRKSSRSDGLAVDFNESDAINTMRSRPHDATAVDLERAISGLPLRARTVFVLHDVEGFKHHEIAVLADMAIGTSKAHLNRARKLLREALTP